MIRKEQLYEQILEQIDLTKETDDEELQELIRTVLDAAADEGLRRKDRRDRHFRWEGQLRGSSFGGGGLRKGKRGRRADA